jgi:hypothetical protein
MHGATVKVDFTSFLNPLKVSNFAIFRGKCLYNLILMCGTLFWSKDVLRDCVWRSYLLLVLCTWISQFCLRSPLYFFMKHKTSKTYIEVTVRIELSGILYTYILNFKNKSQEITLVKNDKKCVPMHHSSYFGLHADWLELGTHLELTRGGAVPVAICNLCLI